MDPLSISMSILTIIGSITATVKTAKSLLSAPEELESLLNDLAEAEILIRDVKACLGDYNEESSSPQVDRLQERMIESEKILEALNGSVMELLSQPDDLKSVKRYAWLKAKKKIRKLTKRLAQIHKDLPGRLAQVDGNRIKLELKDMSLIQSNTASQVSRLTHMVGNTSKSLAELHAATNARHQTLSSSMEQLFADTSHQLQRLESTIVANKEISQRFSPILPPLPDSFPAYSRHSSTLHDNHQSKTALTTATLDYSPLPTVGITCRYTPPDICKLTCQCQCHQKRRITSPSFLHRALGQIFIDYRGLPIIAKSCTDPSCKRRASQSRVYVTYYFPRWWVTSRIMLLAGIWGTLGTPRVALSFPRLIPDNSYLFYYAQSGNVEAVKSLFTSGQASPNDMTTLSTLSWFALGYGQWTMFKCLFYAGADLDIECSGGDVKHKACEMFLVGKLPNDFGQWLAETFLWNTIDELGLSELHKVVLGLRHTTIQEEIARLVISSRTINDQDSFGSTPLWWACARGDYTTTLFLLQTGADPNVPNKANKSPLQVSIQYGSLKCATALLEFNASAQHVTQDGWTTLMYATTNLYSWDEVFFDKLLQRGVDIQQRTENGYTALSQAIQRNKHMAIRWLFSHGADWRYTYHGNSMLHCLGSYGDLETMRIVRNASISNVDVHEKNSDNETPMDLVLEPLRPTPSSGELIEYFQHLLNEIEARTNENPNDLLIEEVTVNSEPDGSIARDGQRRNDLHDEFRLDSFTALGDSEEESELVFHDSVEMQGPVVGDN